MTHTEILANLEEIENVARMACEEFLKVEEHKQMSVNFGDFGVVEVRYWMSKDAEGFSVLIEECSPEETHLYRWFNRFFLDRGYTNPPEFRFEW